MGMSVGTKKGEKLESQQWLIMHESFHHEMAKTMNDLIFLSAIVSEMFFQFSTLLCTLTLGIYYSNDDKCLAEKRLFSILRSHPSSFPVL
jgi:hypothetical protein